MFIGKKKTLYYLFSNFLISKIHARYKKSNEKLKPYAILSKDFLSLNVLFHGGYETTELESINNFLLGLYGTELHSSTFVDVGANIGTHSRYFAPRFEKVLAIEPQFTSYELLKFNLSHFSNVTTYNLSLFSESTLLFLVNHPNNYAGAHLSKFTFDMQGLIDKYGSNVIQESQAVTLDSLLFENSIKTGLIKIDVEGAEYDVLLGSIATLEKFKPIILLEAREGDILDSGGTKATKFLKKLGYTEFYSVETKIELGEYRNMSHLLASIIKNLFVKNSTNVEKIQSFIGKDYRMVIAISGKQKI